MKLLIRGCEMVDIRPIGISNVKISQRAVRIHIITSSAECLVVKIKSQLLK